jgi:hypothetical protein
MQYYSFDEEKWIDIPVTSDHYVSDSSDDAKLGYVKFTSDDDGEKELSEFLRNTDLLNMIVKMVICTSPMKMYRHLIRYLRKMKLLRNLMWSVM